MCLKCNEDRKDFSSYKGKRLPLRLFRLVEVERSPQFHDTKNYLECSSCGASAFRGNAVHEHNSSSGGKWIVQCLACGWLHILPFREWEALQFELKDRANI